YFDAETGLHYNRHRYYNPGTGRFLTPDPIKLAGGLNNYRYVPNPTGWVDPLGLATVPVDCPGATPKRPKISSIDPNEVRFSQTSVSYKKVDRNGNNYTYDDLVAGMKEKGWQGDPIDVVRMPDHHLTSMDNTRVRAAREAGINVEIRERGYNDPVSEAEQQRFAVKGKKPETWGQAIELRVGKQSPKSFGRDTPYGSYDAPKLSGQE
ncbi:RHS repeat-associated core domain-containing protein, partial [Pseudomonas cichorii]|nr:RHS repeat-associated core domain-containing protein [Pseudomonas cichorii]